MSNLLQDKVFVFAQPSLPQDSEKEIICQIFEENNLDYPLRISVINNSENYDSYKVDTGKQAFFVRLSLDQTNPFSTWEERLFSPKIFKKGWVSFGQDIFFVIEEFCNEYPVSEIGESILSQNIDQFTSQLKKIHNSKKSECNLRSFIKNKFQKTSLDKNKEYEELIEKNSSNFSLLKEEMEDAKSQITKQYCQLFDGQSLVHGGISPSNLLLGERGFVFTSWENSTFCNPLFDIAEIEFNFQISKNTEYALFEKLNTDNLSWENYFSIKNYWAYVKLIDLTHSYIKEVFLYDSKRHNEILKIIKLFYKNIQKFEKLDSFKKNREELLNFFGQSVS